MQAVITESWQPCGPREHDEEIVYDVRAQDYTTLIELPSHAFLVISEQDLAIAFAIFQYAHEDDQGNVRHTLMMSGWGTGGALRECRHTYWGDPDNGYLFYPDFGVITAALEALRKWFDA